MSYCDCFNEDFFFIIPLLLKVMINPLPNLTYFANYQQLEVMGIIITINAFRSFINQYLILFHLSLFKIHPNDFINFYFAIIPFRVFNID